MLLFYPLLLGSCALVSAPDTTARPPVNQAVKLGLHAFAPADLTLSYERQLSPRWSVSGGVGYYGQTSRSGSIYHAYDGSFIEDWYSLRDRFYSVDVQVRHYFRPRARPLTGWYTAANLHTFLRHSTETHTLYTQQDYDINNVLTQLELHLGRQWALGRRVTLDTYGGWSFPQSRLANSSVRVPRRYSRLGFGVQLGYRFRRIAWQ